MEEELKELERRVSRLEKITGNTYDIYLCNDSLKIPIELFKILFPSNSYSVENIELHKEIDKLRNEKKQLESLVTNLLLKSTEEKVEVIWNY